MAAEYVKSNERLSLRDRKVLNLIGFLEPRQELSGPPFSGKGLAACNLGQLPWVGDNLGTLVWDLNKVGGPNMIPRPPIMQPSQTNMGLTAYAKGDKERD